MPTDYQNIHIPGDLNPEEYSYQQRRAELYGMIIEAGHPDLINQTRLAEYYGVDQSTISRDMATIRDAVEEELAGDAQFLTRIVYKRAIREMVEQEAWMEATELLDRWNEFLFNLHGSGLESAANKHAFDHEADFDLDVDDDGHVTSDLPEQAQQNIEELHAEVRVATSDTRIDEDGDDVAVPGAGEQDSDEVPQDGA